MKNCYNKSFLDPQEAFLILNKMYKILGESYYKSIPEYFEEKIRKEEERNKWTKMREQQAKDYRIRLISEAKLLHPKSSRQSIVRTTYDLKYPYPFKNAEPYEEFDRKMKIYPKDKILKDLKLYLENLVESNNNSREG